MVSGRTNWVVWRREASGNAGKCGRNPEHQRHVALDGRAQHHHSPGVLACAEQRQSEGRLDERAYCQETDEDDGECVHVRGPARQVESEQTEDRCDGDTLQTIVATGQPGGSVDEIKQDQVQAKRHHQQSDTVQTADDPTCRQPRDACHETGDDKAADGLSPTVLA
jgi:hypothetical protein